MTDTPDLPAHWTPAAVDAVSGILAQRPDLGAAELAMLNEAAELITSADELAAAARAGGLVVAGSMGQTSVSPLVVEARLARTAAGAILARLVPRQTGTGSRGGNGRFRPRMSGDVAR